MNVQETLAQHGNDLEKRIDALETLEAFDLLRLGEMLFTADDGLLLLNSHGEINATEWWSQRRQKATISGAFHQEAGRWPGTRGLVVEKATTNQCVNPSFETNTTSWGAVTATTNRTTAAKMIGDYGLSGVATAQWGRAYYERVCGAGTYTVSIWVKTSSSTLYLDLRNETDQTDLATDTHPGDECWHRLVATGTIGATKTLGLQLVDSATGSWRGWYADAAQWEDTAYATTYCDGDMGTGYAWTGAAHASTSTRTVATVNLDAYGKLFTPNGTASIRTVVQMPYDANATWADDWPKVFDLYINAGNWIYLQFAPATDKWYLNLTTSGGNTGITAAAVSTFKAGDWLDIVVVMDSANNKAWLYINGEMIGSTAGAYSIFQPTSWKLGSDYGGQREGGCVFDEYAVFDSVLSAAEVTGIYALQRPLVDAGAMEGPVVDGRWVRLPVNNDNVGSPPTDAEITSAFGYQPDGFTGIIDDNGAGTTVWKVWRTNSKWWYEQVTAAV